MFCCAAGVIFEISVVTTTSPFVITLPAPQNDGDILQVVEFVTTNLRGGLPWKGMSDELKGPQKVGPSWMTDSHLLVVFGVDTYHFHSEIDRPLLAYRAVRRSHLFSTAPSSRLFRGRNSSMAA
jgi:hypothetical protein